MWGAATRTIRVDPSPPLESAMAATVITYERGDTYVDNIYKAKEKNKEGKEIEVTKTAHGLVGTLWVGGYAFDTLERMDGYVKLKPGRYEKSSMYVDKKRGKVVNPWLGALESDPQYRNILIHSGSVPSHFEGCIGVGFLEAGKLTYSNESMEILWEQCGGTVGKEPIVSLVVVGEMPALKGLKKATGG